MQYDQLDSEHVGLFAALLELENNPSDQAVVDRLQSLMRDHFYYEEAHQEYRFRNTMVTCTWVLLAKIYPPALKSGAADQ